MTTKGNGWSISRKRVSSDCFGVSTKENTVGAQVPIRSPSAGCREDLVSQLGIYAVSLMDRTSGYGPEDMGSTPVLRAIGFSLAEQIKRVGRKV